MRLLKTEISNFRSIKDVTISFDTPCRVLVGINESGKSNIIRALSLLGSDNKPVRKDDVRDSLPDEDEVKEAFVRFYFRLDKSETDRVFSVVQPLILSSARDPEIAIKAGHTFSLRKFCNERNDVRYYVDLVASTKSTRYPGDKSGFSLNGDWFKPVDGAPPLSVRAGESTTTLTSARLIRAADFPEIPSEHLVAATIDDLVNVVGHATIAVAGKSLPETLLWSYDEDNLLPSQVELAAFIADPDSCVPLRNMFLLAGIEDIGADLSRVKDLTPNKRQSYLDRVAEKTTKHFRAVWKEYAHVEFQLRFEGTRIIPGIKEHNAFDFVKRSDGFKRFVTFLLLVSITAKLDALSNTLLLIDEPDIGLHPAGARYLRDELIKIANNNYVLYSTHSIFMIDPGEISRHYIVTKTKETTAVAPAKESNVKDEEVLYNALGFSTFQILSEKNVIFEGWRDKKLFSVALPKLPAAQRRPLEQLGVCHAKGVPNIKQITPLIELAGRACVIVSDADAAAKQQQKQYRASKGFGEWLTYPDVDAAATAITGEDFVKPAHLVDSTNHIVAPLGLPAIAAASIPVSGRLAAIKAWLATQGTLTQPQIDDVVDQIKGYIFDTIQPKDIEPSYLQLLQHLATRIQA